MLRLFPLSLLVLCVSFLSDLLGEDPLVGKRVVVINDKATLAVSGQPSGKAKECSVFTVDNVAGDWLWIKSERAYLWRADVVPFEDAIGHYTRRLETSKTGNNYWNRSSIWRLKGELDIALGDMNEAIRLSPNESSWFDTRGNLWLEKNETDKALGDYNEAIRLDPKSGTAYHNRGCAWFQKKEFDKAISDFNDALKYKDANETINLLSVSQITGGDSTSMVNSRASSFCDRGQAWFAKKNYEKAIADYDEAIRLDPKYQDPRSKRRKVWEQRGDFSKLATDLEATLKEAPPTAKLCNEFAWLRATCPNEKQRNGKQAIEYATKACDLTQWKEANYLDTLAAAYAESGDFISAVRWQKNGAELANSAQKADFESRLKLYQEMKPYREPSAK